MMREYAFPLSYAEVRYNKALTRITRLVCGAATGRDDHVYLDGASARAIRQRQEPYELHPLLALL